MSKGLWGVEGGDCRVWVILKISGVPVPAAERSPGDVLRGSPVRATVNTPPRNRFYTF